jgi:hypothetical protein
MTFKNYLTKLQEALITFGGRRPKFGQVVLLAGGAGSGKGFIVDKLISIDAKVFDVDQIKSQIISPKTLKLNKKIQDIYGIDVTKLDLKVPEDVFLLHKINDEMGISKSVQDEFFAQQRNKDRLPNIIFDTTMKSMKKLNTLLDTVKAAGYKKENIHLVWVVQDVDMAVKQNLERDRVVPYEILMQTHQLVSATMAHLLKNLDIQNYLDGDVWLVFNKRFVDSTLEFTQNIAADSITPEWLEKSNWTRKEKEYFTGLKKNGKKKYQASYVKDAVLLKIKERGKKQIPFSEVGPIYIKKIKAYVPKDTLKLWESLEN